MVMAGAPMGRMVRIVLLGLPDAWANGHISGLRARGNFGVSLQWKNGKLTSATITSDSGESCHVRYGQATLNFPTEKGKTYHVVWNNGQLLLQ